MEISILTIFPALFDSVFSQSIIKKAVEKKAANIKAVDIRKFAEGRHKITDDKPYGGGAGMIMVAPPIVKAIESVRRKVKSGKAKTRVILLSPQGSLFTQDKAKKLSKYKHLILVCGHYGGVDERILKFVDEEISVGDYVLTGGEIPAMVITDAVVRILPGVVGKKDSVVNDSLWDGKLAPPAYTRPYIFRGMKVPDALMSGNHAKIGKWRAEKAAESTNKKRPDLVERRKNGKSY